MAAGYFFPSLLFGNPPGLTASYPFERPRPVSAWTAAADPRRFQAAAVNRGGPLEEFVREFEGYKYGSYFFDYYSTVYLIPLSINFGAVTRTIERTFYVWNAHTTQQTLTSITESGTMGLDLLAPSLPTTFRRIEHKPYVVKATTEGPAYIDARYTFTFGNGVRVTMPVFGSRAELWRLQANWSERYDVAYEYLTDIVVSRSGREQRRALRSTPRKSLEFQAHATRDQLRWLNRVMGGWHPNAFLMPELTRSVRTIEPIGTGSPSVLVDDAPHWLKEGASIVLNDGRRYGTRLIERMEGNRIVFTAAGNDTWVAGTRVHPGLSGNVAAEIQTQRLTSEVAVLQVAFDATPGIEEFPDPPAPETTWGVDNTEVVLIKPNYSNPISLTFAWPTEDVDYRSGVIRRFTPIQFSTRTWQANYLGFDRQKVQAFLDVFRRAMGRRGEFYMPTWENDLPPMDDLTPGSFRLRTPGPEVANLLNGDRVYRSIAVFTHDGRVFFNRVAQIDPIEDERGLDSILTMSSSWTQAIPVSSILRVCWMPRWRFASDRLVISWLTDEVASITTSMMTLEDLQ